MESLLTCLTKSTIKDIERNDFRAESYLKNNNIQHYQPTKEEEHDDIDDDDSSFEDDDNSEYSNQQMSNIIDESNMEDTLANLNLDDYDSIKYTGLSAGLQLLDENLFKSKSYVQLPGREDVALQLMSQNELLVVRSDRSPSGKRPDTRLDVGFSLTSTIFDEKTSSDSWYLTNSSLSKSISKDLPTNSVIEKAVKLYFSHIHLFLPIVNRARFETHDLKSSNVLVQAVLAVSFRFASRHFPKLFNKKTVLYADTYFRKVMLRLQDSNRARLREVQAALLMTLYLDMDETDVESMQWYTLGKAIRMAQDIGLHRSCSNWNLPPSEIETRHRVFYACYVLDRLMGARAGKPLTILDRDFDTDLPVPYEVYDDNLEQGPSIYHSFIHLIELSEILGRILKALYAPKSKHSNSNAGLDDPTILAVFDRRLKNWKASLDQSKDGIKISQAQKEFSSVNTSDANIIHGSVDLDALAKESRQACENAASNISVIVRQKQSLMSDPDSYSPLCLPTCFVYSMFQSSLIHLAIVIKNRDSLRRLRLLQRSIALLKQHEQLSSCQRAHGILVMLVNINGINLENLLENDSTKEDDIISAMNDDVLSQQSPQSPVPAKTRGITPDLHQRLDEDNSSHTLEQLLPYADMGHPQTSQRHQHTRSDSNSTLYQHNRSDSNSTLYHPQENDMQSHHNSNNYYDLTSTAPSLQNSTTNISITKDEKDIGIYNRHHEFNDAGGNLRMLQCDNPPTAYVNEPTLLSHQHNSHGPFTRNGLSSTPALPFTATYGNINTSHSNHSPVTSNAYSINYLPPSNLNWGDWGMYLSQQNTSIPTQQSESSPNHQHLTEQ
ncbi:hypothetical protein INT48_004280 [Thamnidium elegans]|uniref:Xylanolytic transcriptional activator regulatory domain-containing protein n=1 Tax=Thamnidium elegans TaxID=101142 RepID=A0A8H7SWW4_9FUNG|nr:hypothetical protein INT48_004280 [Thamnidium elegans]